MRLSENRSTSRILSGPVRVELRSKAECVGDSRLQEFSAGDGPAAHEVRLILENLHSGEALAQTVALLTAGPGGRLLGLASVRIDGNAQVRAKASTPWFLRRLSRNPYVNLIARDVRYAGHLLADGRTRLGSAVLRAGLEALQHELGGPPLPTVWALVRRENEASKRAFGEFAFYPHDRSDESQQDVYVRRAGRRLPAAPSADAYVPLTRDSELRVRRARRSGAPERSP
jgi:hypothetical protein